MGDRGSVRGARDGGTGWTFGCAGQEGLLHRLTTGCGGQEGQVEGQHEGLETQASANAGRSGGQTLYVQHLPVGTTDERLAKAFRPYGPVASAHTLPPAAGKQAAVGFVSFLRAADAAAASEALSGTRPFGGPLDLLCKPARQRVPSDP